MYENHRCIFTLLSDISLMCSYYPRVRWRFISSMITKKNFLKTGIYGLQMPLLHILFRNKNAYFHENLWNVMILEVWEWKWSSIFLLTVNLLLPFETVIGLNKTCKCPRSCAAVSSPAREATLTPVEVGIRHTHITLWHCSWPLRSVLQKLFHQDPGRAQPSEEPRCELQHAWWKMYWQWSL